MNSVPLSFTEAETRALYAPESIATAVAAVSGTTTHLSDRMDTQVSVPLRDPDSESSEESDIDENELLSHQDELTQHLAAAGTVGVAAAAAIATVKKRGRSKWTFETNPAIRKRQQTRLLRKIKCTLEELQARVGQQVVVLATSPGKPPSSNTFKVYGASPLDGVIKRHQDPIMRELESSLQNQLAATIPQDPTKHDLPPLVIDGIPTPLGKMTQAQLRAFIPLMLKYSTGRPKPGWGKEDMKPVWWPEDLPWQNVRADMRSDDEKQLTQWTDALRNIVRNCYMYHNRMDLLLEMADPNEDLKGGAATSQVGTELGVSDLQQIPALPEQTQVILDLAQHPQLIQHIQAADGSTTLLPQYLEGGQMVLNFEPGSVSGEAQVTLSALVSPHQSTTAIPSTSSADNVHALGNHGTPPCETDGDSGAFHLQTNRISDPHSHVAHNGFDNSIDSTQHGLAGQ